MKDYSLSKEYKKDFILHYEIINNYMYISKADGKIEIKKYSKEEEIKILEKMKNQILNSKEFSTTLNQKFETFVKLFLDESLLLTMFIVTILTLGLPIIPTIIGFITFPVVMTLTGLKLRKYTKLRNDLKKNLLFIKNEDKLNPILRKDTELLKEKTNNFSFTLNTINDISYKQLIDLYSTLNKPKKLTKKRHN